MVTKFKVIYHAYCVDGMTAAYLLWLELGDKAEYIPMQYGVDLDVTDFDKDTIVYIVDFSFKRDMMLHLCELCKNVYVFDHHKTAETEFENLEAPNLTAIFDMSKSGAQITYEFLYKNSDYSNLVAYTADRDLWKFELPDSKTINAYIQAVPFTFEEWDNLNGNLIINLPTIITSGGAILMYQQKQIDNAVSHAVECCINSRKLYHFENPKVSQLRDIHILAVNTTVNFSEVAGELAKNRAFGVAWFQRSDGKFQYSLRSDSNGLDVSQIAKIMGGGGHARAAGFESETQVLDNVER